ncbi:uncharacterized protein LOC132182274 isoform X2 [Corylus avellana]|uniref:uncharacterized protein LOC132182274 isoform X2 n=1 Tax=Corylus avellana TaxID=13451 RepID=UPI00286B19DD|nr:uncharacterized protein LOC132182274 isoform X2 [Corylus avellana]
MVMEKKKEEQLEDERREELIASTPSLQPNFKAKGGITQTQLSKFHELHKRRLQIKSKSKIKKKSKDGNGKSHSKDRSVLDCVDADSTISIEESSVSNSESHNNTDSSSLKQNNVAAPLALKKRQKLHWGLDTKERWERKANM